jgi:NAD+ kinase
MPEPLRRLAILTHLQAGATEKALVDLAAAHGALGLDLLLPPEEQEKHPRLVELGYQPIEEPEIALADACLVFGGDGTILRAMGRLLGSNVPTMGVNFGNVGFLADLPPVGWQDRLAVVIGGDYSIVELLTVEARFNGQRYAGVNDIVLTRREPHGVLHLEYAVSGTPVGIMRCDGMIVATPAGSTAYNLSCGGPVVVWDASALVLNFVAPHSLGFRPLVLRPDHVVTVRNGSPCDVADVLADGHVVGSLACGELLTVASSPLRARLMVCDAGTFYRNVEHKLFGAFLPTPG